MTAALARPKLGVTLYSFTPYFHARQYSFWDLIRIAGERNLGPGLEVVGFQSIKGFPRLPDGFATRFRRAVDDAGLELSALGANADAGIHQERLLSDDELEEYMLAQLETAHALGFPTVRVQYSVTPDLMERLLPHAERLGLTLGMEIHAPHSVHHPDMLALLERYEQLRLPVSGLHPRLGCLANPCAAEHDRDIPGAGPARGPAEVLRADVERVPPRPDREERRRPDRPVHPHG